MKTLTIITLLTLSLTAYSQMDTTYYTETSKKTITLRQRKIVNKFLIENDIPRNKLTDENFHKVLKCVKNIRILSSTGIGSLIGGFIIYRNYGQQITNAHYLAIMAGSAVIHLGLITYNHKRLRRILE